MTQSPLVTVIIPTHNRRQLLEETLASVSAQSIDAWQCVVVDDASSDATPEFLARLTDERFDCSRFDQGQERSRCRNFGLGRAAGRYVLFLDDDDLLPPDTLALHLRNIERDSRAFCSIGSSCLFWPDGMTRDWIATSRRTLRHVVDELVFGWIPVSGQCLFRADAVRAVGGWNETMSYAEDHELMLRLAAEEPAAVMPDFVHRYRFHDQWRPTDMSDIMTRVRLDFIARAPAKRREHFQRILRARDLREAAEQAYEDTRMGSALRLYLAMLRLAPTLYGSPLTGRDLLRPLLKACLGGPLVRAARSFRSRTR